MKLQGGLVLLRESYEALPETEKKVARYILDNPLAVIESNINQVAAKAGSSVSAIVRLCKRIGMNGFRELKLSLTLDATHRQADQLARQGGSLEEGLAHSLVRNHITALEDVLKVLDIAALRKAVAAIARARRLDIYGEGASAIVAMDFFQKLLRIGFPCCHSPDSHLQIISACGLSKEDAAFAISYSGETRSVLKAVREAKKSGAAVIGLTRFGRNALAELSDVVLFVPSSEPLIREAAMSSRITQLVMIDILFSILICREKENLLQQLARTMKAVR
jgi:DNA-binding MurR/RpiR family transcriptional regulator